MKKIVYLCLVGLVTLWMSNVASAMMMCGTGGHKAEANAQ